MSESDIKAIIATYEPVEGKPGYVWFSKRNNQIVHVDVLKEAYRENFNVREVREE